MANQTLSQSVSDFRTMSSGINTRIDTLAGVGITAADATTMSDYADQLDALNAQQEELKAQLKAKTEELNATMKAAKAKNSELTKRLKIAVPQSEWLAFGVTAKR
jgi:cell shape-determining protein MreC